MAPVGGRPLPRFFLVPDIVVAMNIAYLKIIGRARCCYARRADNNVGVQTRCTANTVWHEEDRLEIHRTMPSAMALIRPSRAPRQESPNQLLLIYPNR